MDNNYQELISSLSGRQNMLLTMLLSGEDEESWEQSKHLIICHSPFLTLEMAVNRICHRRNHSIPSPAQIHAALEYATNKKKQFLHNISFSKITS